MFTVDRLFLDVLGLDAAELGDDLLDAVLLCDDVLLTTGLLAPASLYPAMFINLFVIFDQRKMLDNLQETLRTYM